MKVCKAEEGKKKIVNPKIQIEDFYWCLNQVICNLDYRNI